MCIKWNVVFYCFAQLIQFIREIGKKLLAIKKRIININICLEFICNFFPKGFSPQLKLVWLTVLNKVKIHFLLITAFLRSICCNES